MTNAKKLVETVGKIATEYQGVELALMRLQQECIMATAMTAKSSQERREALALLTEATRCQKMLDDVRLSNLMECYEEKEAEQVVRRSPLQTMTETMH